MLSRKTLEGAAAMTQKDKEYAARRSAITVDGYSVVLHVGGTRFALHSTGVAGRAFFRRWRDAVAFRRELAAHKIKGDVVPVTATMRLRKRT